MSQPIVPGITDEQIAEIERWADFGGDYLKVKNSAVTGLIARLRAAEKDAARYRWLRDKSKDCPSQAPAIVMLTEYCQPAFDDVGSAHRSLVHGYHADQAIDTAMEQQP